ncbi:hypothetical protein POTOM_022134 [Populus tomentosa]|uniref:RNA-binding S4 domain-containing protein n=1 Tax=Populus tomentosa TaxID=118781 RepID=A0A8X7ZT88_POPTO|nr:hypothetical protein POTOM_022134 [Populus tomentosa]
MLKSLWPKIHKNSSPAHYLFRSRLKIIKYRRPAKKGRKKNKRGCSPFHPCPVAQLPPPSSLKSQELYDSSLFNLVPKDTLVRTRINDFCVKLEETVDSKSGKLRLDSWISCRISGISRARVQSIIKSGIVSVNGKITYKFSHNVKAGDEIDCIILEWKPLRVVHPAPGNATGTLVNGILHHCSLPTVSNQEVLSDAEDISDDDDGEGLCSSSHVASVRPGIVHRLDKGTSGLLVVAKFASFHCFVDSHICARGKKYIFHARLLQILQISGASFVKWEQGRNDRISRAAIRKDCSASKDDIVKTCGRVQNQMDKFMVRARFGHVNEGAGKKILHGAFRILK